MAANLGQALMGSGGMMPSLAQELASGNFQESRESFHDYIYSKLILGEDKTNTQSTSQLPQVAVGSNNPPVFPNNNLANSYPNPPQQGQQQGNNLSTSSSAFVSPLAVSAQQTMNSKAGSSKKKSQQAQQIVHHSASGVPMLTLTPGATPGTEGEGLTQKPKKKSHHKKKEKTNVCDVCGRGFAEKYTLNRHMLTHTNIKPYACTKCNMAFSRSDGLAKHMAAGHRRIDAHHCDVCGGTFNSEVSFEQHRREYGSTLPFVCNLCMLAFSQCCHLNYHMKSHQLNKLNDSISSADGEDKNNPIDVSELIPEDFAPLPKPPGESSQKDPLSLSALFPFKLGDKKGDASLLLDGSITVKPEIDDMSSCSAINPTTGAPTMPYDALTGLPSSSASSLNIANSFVNSANFDKRTGELLASDSGTGSAAAPISDAEMKKYFDIKIPHPGTLGSGAGTTPGEEGLFRCEICGKGFTRKYHMQRHVRLHTRGPVPRAHLLDWTRRPYACGVCKMGFTRQHHLTRHMLIHTGERPHACHVCGKAFRRFTNLSLHVRTVHGAERPFKCPVCGRGFPRLYSLQRHLKLHTKEAEARRKGTSTKTPEETYLGIKPSATKPKPAGSTKDSATPDHDDSDSDRSDEGDKPGEKDIVDLTEDAKLPQEYNLSRPPSQQPHTPQVVEAQGNSGAVQQQQQQQRIPNNQTIEVVNQHSRILSHTPETLSRQARTEYVAPERYGTPNNQQIQSPGMANLELQHGRGAFTEIDLQEAQAQGFTLTQQGNSDRFTLHQGNHSSLLSGQGQGANTLIVTQGHDNSTFTSQHNNSFARQQQQQQSQQQQQQRNTMSPAIRTSDSSGRFAHSQHLDVSGNGRRSVTLEMQMAGSPSINLDLQQANSRAAIERAMANELQQQQQQQQGNRNSSLSEQPNYTLQQSHAVQFSAAHAIYQQAMGDNLGRIELHPDQSVSPMPMNNHPHSSNLQYQ